MSERRLVAIMFTDIVGYSALTQKDETVALRLLEKHNELIRPIISKHAGIEVKTIGDSFLIEFGSALDATECAVELQEALRSYNEKAEEKLSVRVGIHVGDVVHRGNDVFGDAVNIASRIETAAQGGKIRISEQVYAQVRNKMQVKFKKLEPRELKNISFPIDVYEIEMPWEVNATAPTQFDKRRIAVLPFANMSPDPSDEYFADGLTEELISTLSRIGGLKVIARTSIIGYKRGSKKISDISKELEVGTILEGSVRRAGDRIRITSQLIDSNTSEHLWSESYDREMKDIFSIQSDIAKTVAEALRVRLSSLEKAVVEMEQTANPEAHALYLKGRFYLNERTRENVNRAMEYFEKAVKVDSEFGLAYSGMADCYNIMGDYNWMDPERTAPLAKEFSRKALAIDDRLAEAHASYALTLMYEWDFADAEKELKRALELRPNYATAYHWYGLLLVYLGRYGEAHLKEKMGLDIDPHSRVLNMGMANSFYFLGEHEHALQIYRHLLDLNPDFAAARMWMSNVLASMSRYDEAIDEAKRACTLDMSLILETNLASMYASAGRKAEAEEIIQRVVARSKSEHVPSAMMGLVYLMLGHSDEGFELLKKGLAERDTGLLMMTNDPSFKIYQSDPRWKGIAEQLRQLLTSK